MDSPAESTLHNNIKLLEDSAWQLYPNEFNGLVKFFKTLSLLKYTTCLQACTGLFRAMTARFCINSSWRLLSPLSTNTTLSLLLELELEKQCA
jgi:hypothetical protein